MNAQAFRHRRWLRAAAGVFTVLVCSAALLQVIGSGATAAASSDPILGDWNVTYGAPAVVTMTLSNGVYTETAKTPVQVSGASCSLPIGTVISTFSVSGSNTYTGQHGLWYTSDCSFGFWDPMTLTLSPDGNTLTAVLDGGYGTVVFTKSTSSVTITGKAFLAAGTANQPYQTSLSASGGTPPYIWSIVKGRLPTGTNGQPLSLTTGGQISGTPRYAGTSVFSVKVTDSSSPTESATRLTFLPVEPPTPLQNFQLYLNQHNPPSTSTNGGPVVVNPHVAFVVVGTWWCGIFGSKAPPQCAGQPSNPAEPTSLVAAVSSLVAKDYNDASAGGYDEGLSHYFQVTGCGIFGGCQVTPVGRGVATRPYAPYGGAVFAGPVTQSQADNASGNLRLTLNSLAGSFGINSQADVNDTVFVLLHAPNLLPAPCTHNPSTNGMTGPGTQTSYGSFVFADVYLDDSAHTCPGDFNQSNPAAPVTPTQFATFATSHELDEAITSPGASIANTSGWLLQPGLQIADPCTDRNAAGQTGYSDPAYPYFNFTRDLQGTVVAAYVNPSGNFSQNVCYPNAGTSVPPG